MTMLAYTASRQEVDVAFNGKPLADFAPKMVDRTLFGRPVLVPAQFYLPPREGGEAFAYFAMRRGGIPPREFFDEPAYVFILDFGLPFVVFARQLLRDNPAWAARTIERKRLAYYLGAENGPTGLWTIMPGEPRRLGMEPIAKGLMVAEEKALGLTLNPGLPMAPMHYAMGAPGVPISIGAAVVAGMLATAPAATPPPAAKPWRRIKAGIVKRVRVNKAALAGGGAEHFLVEFKGQTHVFEEVEFLGRSKMVWNERETAPNCCTCGPGAARSAWIETSAAIRVR